MKVYKYFSFDINDLDNDKKIDSLQNNYLWFSKPRFFNDPFDCNMEILNYYNEFINSINGFGENAKDLIINNTKDFGVCCFTESNDNIHMWSHYAESHKGICVEYDATAFNDYFSESLTAKCFLHKADYRDNLINLDSAEELNKEFGKNSMTEIIKDPRILDNLFEKLLLQKRRDIWENEEEHRLIVGGLAIERGKMESLPAGHKVLIKRDMIKSIIFGNKTPENVREKIHSIFNDSVKYKESKLDFENWKLKVE